MKRAYDSLRDLTHLRQLEVERGRADLAAMESLRQRMLANLDRVEQLSQHGYGQLAPALALAAGIHKQALQEFAARQRSELKQHDASIAQARRNLAAAAARHAALDHVLTQRSAEENYAAYRRQQRHEDELATHAWLRPHPIQSH